ncbi:LuxR family transcriptional regulator [Neorhizobium sp. JUb45]|uniref:helix-turn-helix transcriptional regulator n=1 Tax=unclassified Neorhizobium TaxID=2629175 RepID=UPI001045BD3D|nr:LuxR family transcriptional regulator [Neorhizobium sp. JUb45]TCR01306.1 LuxR family transcriptional regulator [Neorhizobium sp. JUb45]
MTVHSILQFLVLAHEAKSQTELAAEFEAVLKNYNFSYYGVWMKSKSLGYLDSTVLWGRSPDGWQETYAAKKFGLVDPTIRMLAVAQRPFRWREAVSMFRSDPNRKRIQRMMQDASRSGLHDGYTFPIHGRNGLLGHVSIGGQFIDLSPAEMTMFDAAAKKMFWRTLELGGQTSHFEAIKSVETTLTRRETEVLHLLAEGMTSHEIAKTLTISNHTVDWYINAIQEKFEASNRQHVVAIAFRLGLVS